MYLRTLTKFGLAALVLAAASLPARAAFVSVNKIDGVNFSYTAVDTNGVLTVTFDATSLVTKINNALVTPPLPATFAQLTLTTKPTFDDIPGLSLHFFPPLNSTQFGIPTLANTSVVFDYSIAGGQVFANGLTLTGTAQLDPSGATTFTSGGNTYDFSAFTNPGFFTLSLGTQDTNPTLIYDVLKSGNGTFSGTGQFDAQVSVVPEPSSVLLLGIGGIVTVLSRRFRKA